MTTLGYAYVHERLGLRVLPVAAPAVIRSVTRMERFANELAVPAKRAPGADVIEHLLFALKHEGTDLQVLAAACPHLEPAALLSQLRAAPAGQYIRKLCAIWEQTTRRRLEDLPAGVAGSVALLFDPEFYLTIDQAKRDKRWGVAFNGLGDWDFCPSVRRTPALEALLKADLLGQVRAFLNAVPPGQLERALAWAYLDETRSSYEIEGERPAINKAEAFAALLRGAHERQVLSEEHWVELQNATVTNPLAQEASFRTYQNHLSNGVPGARGVTYLPPPPEMIHSLIASIARLANLETGTGLDPLVRAALVSFGFVFTHPFGDGNGRLSRYLAHYALCQSGGLPNGSILPLSAAMRRNELAYLKALQSFSTPARALWQVQWIDAEDFDFSFLGEPCIYRYWDATACVTFLCEMALEALRKDLRDEVTYLACYDEIVRRVNDRYDLAGSTLSKLIRMAYQNGGVLSKNRRKQFVHLVGLEALEFIEAQVRELLQQLELTTAPPGSSAQ
jgi:Fic/DOC family